VLIRHFTGRMKPEGMITKTIALDKVVEEGFTTLIEDKENHVKILVDVGNSISK
jgi:threonine dehydrogenase-like Zn-dependent dehydrogenase